MQFRNKITDTALLGTGKHPLSLSELPDAIQPYVAVLEGLEPEEQFMKASALSFAYYRAGVIPVKMELPTDEATAETVPYCTEKASTILDDLLSEKYNSLIWLWTRRCSEHNKIVRPEMLPAFFDWGVSIRKQYPSLFVSVIGQRGLWLSKYNSLWAFVDDVEEITDWETATGRQRINYLHKLRHADPSSVVEKIKAIWKEENAAGRLELISTLSVNLSPDDELFLTDCLTDKSKQVKEKALELLKSLPASKIINEYKDILRRSVIYRESKLLGLISRTSMEIQLAAIDESIFKTGIDKMSSDKTIADNDYILSQLIREVPPSFWRDHFSIGISEVVKLFGQKEELKKFQNDLSSSAIKFADKEWAEEILKQFENPDVYLLSVIDENKRHPYADRFKGRYTAVIEALRTKEPTEWKHELALAIIKELAGDPYRYTKSFFEGISLYLPATIAPELGTIVPDEEWKKNFWANTSDEITKLINIKESIKNLTF